MPIQLAGIDCVSELKRSRNLTLSRIGRVLIEFEFFDRNRERSSVRFVNETLYRNVARKEVLIENDSEFLIGRPILRRLKDEHVLQAPMPFSTDLRFDPDALKRSLMQIFQSRRGCAEIKI